MDELSTWISTGDALRLLNLGICVETFRTKFRDCIPWKRTPGGHIRWHEPTVRAIANNMPNDQNAKYAQNAKTA